MFLLLPPALLAPTVGAPALGRSPWRDEIHGEQAMFTEVPCDVRALRGQDVEMACSFRGAGTPSYSLEIQWWYIRNRADWTDNQPWSTNEVSPVSPGGELPKDATKISVVKVAGSNISHKLRLSAVRPSDEGTYECRVIDFSDAAGARHHRARAYLQGHQDQDQGLHARDQGHQNQGLHARDQGHQDRDQGHQDRDKGHAQSLGHHTHVQGPHALPLPLQQSQADGEQSDGSVERDVPSDCPDEPSCVP
ncbi:unnamed protein product [Lota lota]